MSKIIFPQMLITDGYHQVDDEAVAIELEGAKIAYTNDSFGAFTLIVGFRDKSFCADPKNPVPFICIKNHVAGKLNLFISDTEA